jgi:uncharacterized protein YggU (UPF0235/DUF167 family)
VVQVRASRARGHATQQTRKALAAGLGTPPSDVTLLRGRRSQEKVFDLARMTRD